MEGGAERYRQKKGGLGGGALKGGKMDPVIEEEKCCRHTVLPGEKPCKNIQDVV